MYVYTHKRMRFQMSRSFLKHILQLSSNNPVKIPPRQEERQGVSQMTASNHEAFTEMLLCSIRL